MAAIASSPTWIPEDDILLKKSVEAGASLEALAKGAVQFSRKFTVKELRSRWHSVLYDPEVSAEASTHMFEYELSDSRLFSRLKLCENHKESMESPGKRKAGSIRSQYYAMRKKLRADTADFTRHNLSDVMNLRDRDNNIGSEVGTLSQGHHPENYLFHEDAADHFKMQNTGDVPHHLLHVGRNFIRARSMNNRMFHYDGDNSLEETLASGLFDYSEVRLDYLGENDRKLSPAEQFLCEEVSHAGEDSLVEFQNCMVEETGQSQAQPNENLIEADCLEKSSIFHDNLDNIGCGFRGTEPLSSRTAPSTTCNFNVRDNSMDPGMTFEVSSGHGNHSCDQNMHFTCDLIHPRPVHDDRHGDDMHSSAVVSESEFVDLPDSLLNLDDEELLFISQISEDTFNTINLHSCKDSQEDDRQIIDENPASVSATSHTCFPDSVCPSPKASDACTSALSIPASCDDRMGSNSESSAPQSVLLTNTFSPDSHYRVCTLNTEDPDIPNNDDITFPMQTKIFLGPHCSKNNREPISSPSIFRKRNEGGKGFGKIENSRSMRSTRSGFSSQPFGSRARFNLSVGGDLPERSKCAADNGCSSKEYTNSIPYREPEITSAPASSMDLELIETHSEDMNAQLKTSSLMDVEEYESEDDVPCYSDIEAMILEMDLGPYNQENFICEEVLRYQSEATKRRIIRLEQCAYSYLHRALAVKHALAILYGRNVKYYIKKTEVLLGRSTDAINVDIDLGREGPSNQISRRQAIIKFEENGTFSLKNLGKSSIYVNGKEIATGHVLVLISNCLIEIRDLNFVFEVNYKYITHFLGDAERKT